MSNIVIKELLPSDTFSSLVDKINYNFDQLLLNGGGPQGLPGSPGDIGPMGIPGTKIFTAIDIVDRITELSVNLTVPGDPNKYYPVDSNSIYKIGTTVNPLRHNDLYIEEGDDNTGKDGDIWIYSIITNSWIKTGNNIKGPKGDTGDLGFTQWSRDLTYLQSGRDYLYITDSNNIKNHKLVLGSFESIVEGTNNSIGTVDSESIINITTDVTINEYKYAISIGDKGIDSREYAKITAYNGIFYLKAPNYSNKSINIDANNNIKLKASTNTYEVNSNVLSSIRAHNFYGGAFNIDFNDLSTNQFFRINREGKSTLVIYPTTVNNRIHIYGIDSNIVPLDNTPGSKQIVIKGSNVGIGNISLYNDLNSQLAVYGNTVIGPQTYISHNPGAYNLAVYNKIGIGTFYNLDSNSNSDNQYGSKLIITNRDNATSTNATITMQNSTNSSNDVTGLFFQRVVNTNGSWNKDKEASILYSPHKDSIKFSVNGFANAVNITTDGNVSIGYIMGNYYKYRLAVNGEVRFLCNDNSIDRINGFEILKDDSVIDSKTPSYKGIVIGKNNIGLFNFYKSSLLNNYYNHQSYVFPNYTNIDSSRFNFRTRGYINDPENIEICSIMSLRGYSKETIAVQIGSEYPLSETRNGKAISPERSNFNNVGLHIRKFTDSEQTSLDYIATGLLLQNDIKNTISVGKSVINDIDFYVTKDTNNLKLYNINVPQARIRFKTTEAHFNDDTFTFHENINTGNLEFYTSRSANQNNMSGDNVLTRAMLIDSNADVTIDKNLHIEGYVTINTNNHIFNNISITNIYHNTSNPNWYNVNSVNARLSVGGDIACNGIYTWSDKRLKNNITSIESSLNKILNLRPVFFNWKDDGRFGCGFIAQEVEQYIPEAVLIGSNSDGTKGKYVLNYNVLYTMAIRAIQEQQKQIEEKDKKIVKLEERLANIEKFLNI